MDAAELPPLEAILPHGAGVLLLGDVIEHDGQHTVARVDVSKQRWLRRRDGSVAAWIAVEYMAQCVAAHEALEASTQGRAPVSGVHRLQLSVPEFAPDARLRVSARRDRGRPGLGVLSHRCTIHEESSHDAVGSLLAEGRLSISLRA
jgi:predicted hotdog family 3-hydroxylacyl-ACP dehydratase